MRKGFICLILVIFIALFASSALAEASLELGFDSNIVADHWNKLKLITRDEKAARLELNIDQGNLRDGTNLINYSFNINRSHGIAIFETDIYIPKWQKFTWRLVNEESVLASGSFDRRFANPTKLSLIISANPSKWFRLSNDRTTNISSNSLTKRLASYDGIARIIIDGTAPAPKLEHLIAAATAGANVSLLEPLPSSHNDLVALAPDRIQGLGAGFITRSPELIELEKIELEKIFANFVSNNNIKAPKSKPQIPIVVALSIFAVLVLVLMHLGQKPAIMTSLSLSLIATILAWTYLMPQKLEISKEQSLQIASGELAKELKLTTIFSLRGSQASIDYPGYLLEHSPFKQLDETSQINVQRWKDINYNHKPSLSKALLVLEDTKIINRSKHTLSDVFIKGTGFLADLKPGEAVILAQEDHKLPKLYEGIVGPLPNGTALARYGNNVLIALAKPTEISK